MIFLLGFMVAVRTVDKALQEFIRKLLSNRFGIGLVKNVYMS